MLTGHEVIVKRNIYYRKFYRTNILIFIALLLGISINIGIYRKFAQEKNSPAYFLTGENGKVIRDVPLNLPVYQDDDLAQWTQQSLEKVLNINYINYVRVLQDAAELFSPLGFRQYIRTLMKSKNIEAVKANKYTVISSFLEPMSVKKKMLSKNKTHMWVLEGKVRLLYVNSENLTKPFYQDVVMNVLVYRESFYLYEKGISIGIIIGDSLQ